MCISAKPAVFTGTTVLAHRTTHPEKRFEIDVVAYRNTPQNRAGQGGNAMLLHFPSRTPMGRENFLDTQSCPRFLREIESAAFPERISHGGGTRSMGKGATVFEHDIYTVVLAQSASDIEAAIGFVPEAKRPAVSRELLSFYGESFRGWSLALCCFSNTQPKPAAPLAVWYEPMFPDLLFAPGLDSHTGQPPDLDERVDVDHTVLWSHPNIFGGMPVRYSEKGTVGGFLPTHVSGSRYRNRTMPNGDFVLDVSGKGELDSGAVARFKPHQFQALAAA